MDEYQQRQEAILRFLSGEKISSIARSLNRSRKWLHDWIKRFQEQSGDENWFKDLSKAPKNIHRKLDSEIEQQILFIRQELVNQKMAQIGAISILYECERRGIKPTPSVWTINRVLARHGKTKQVSTYKSPKDYPELFWHTHQMDLVGPRYIKGDGKVYSVNLIDTTSHACHVSAVRTKSSNGIVQALADFWRVHGLPDALQMDNELAFRGSNRHPRSFGSVIRFALSQGVVPVFIPLGEPWRNGMIEKFNDTYQQKFYNAHVFKDLNDLSLQQKSFIDFHNRNHRYSTQQHKSPDQVVASQMKPTYYNGTLHLPQLKSHALEIPLTKGSVYYIRLIRSDLILDLPGDKFLLKPELKYSYVVAEINIDNHNLVVRQNNEIAHVFPYRIEAVDW